MRCTGSGRSGRTIRTDRWRYGPAGLFGSLSCGLEIRSGEAKTQAFLLVVDSHQQYLRRLLQVSTMVFKLV